MNLTAEQLDRLREWIDKPKRDLRIEMCLDTYGVITDAMDETRGMSRGELICRFIEEYGL